MTRVLILAMAGLLAVQPAISENDNQIILAATSGSDGVQMSWLVQGSGNIQSFILQWSLDGTPQPPQQLPGEARAWFMPYGEGVKHEYTLTAVTHEGPGQPSNTATAYQYPWCAPITTDPPNVRYGCLFPLPL